MHAHASPQRRLRRKVVYSFSFSQNKMDCSLTKTVSRGTACAREQRFASESEASTWHASLYHMFVSLGRVVLLSPLRHSHSQSTHTKRVNQMLTVMRLATLRAYWKIHKTATNITHSHYSLTRSLVYSCAAAYSLLRTFVSPRQANLTQFNFIEFISLSWICMSVARNIQMSCGCVLDCLIETRWLLWIVLPCIDVSTHDTRMLCGSLGQIIESYLPLHWVAVRLFTTCATSINMAAIELGSSCQLSLGALSSARAGNSLCRQCKVEHKWMANVIMDMNTCASACSLGQKATQVATFKGAVGYVVSILLSIGCCKKCLNCFKFKF